MVFEAASDVVLPYRYVSRWRRYWYLGATFLPIFVWAMIWLERSKTDAANPNDERIRNNLTTLLVILGLLVIVMIWRSLAQRLVVTQEGLIIGNFSATHKIPWASIQEITFKHGQPIREGSGKHFVESYAIVRSDSGRKMIHITTLTTDAKERLRNNPAVAVLRAVAPLDVRVYPALNPPT